ncbi:MAG TPA: 2-dehydropantoate 2-reductase [Candidatus Sulfotelmatobacter sp.]|nr:2-dehydropantoate 2-reductase [Candidatus Sulfotelmatobacter sp.]
MRMLVVGAGAVGGYFGTLLAQAGRDVTFLVRPRRAEALRASGLQIVSPHGNRTLQPRLITSAELHEPYDVVLFAVKAFALEDAIADFAPAVGPRTIIVPFLNGMRHMDLLDARFGKQSVFGGVCYVATTLDDQGRIVQVDPNLQQLIYGERDGSTSARAAALDAQLQGAGFEARLSTDIMQEMWEKWLILASLGAITCLLRGNVGQIEATPGGAALALRLLAETTAINGAAGYPPRDAYLARAKAVLTEAGAPRATSMYRDLCDGRPVEVEQILGDLLARGRGFGLDTPLLDAATTQLRIYQRGHQSA